LQRGFKAYEVTGMSPQSITLPQKLKGLDFMGLYNVSFFCGRWIGTKEDVHIIPATEADFA
jgi:hypothetical protein